MINLGVVTLLQHPDQLEALKEVCHSYREGQSTKQSGFVGTLRRITSKSVWLAIERMLCSQWIAPRLMHDCY